MMQRTKRAGSILLALIMLAAFFPALPVASAASDDTWGHTTENGQATITYLFSTEASVTIPSDLNGIPVTGIGERAFDLSMGLTTLNIGAGITSIDPYAFEGAEALTNINVDSDNKKYTSVSGVVFTKDKKTLFHYPMGRTAKSYTVPNSVTTIGVGAFFENRYLESVTLPNSVTTIGRSAFNGCSALKNITIPNSVKSIGEYAFEATSGLTIACSSGSYAHTYAKNNNFKIKLLDEPDFNSGDWDYESYDNYIEIMAYKGSAASVSIPSEINGTPVTTILSRAFENNKKVKSVTISKNITKIGGSAFEGCTALKSITIPDNVKSIGANLFSGCTALTEVTLGKGITVVSDFAFYNCKALTKVTFNGKVTKIGTSAFANCTKLASITVPTTVKTFGSGAFSGCTSLKKFTIPDGVKAIAGTMFYGCTALTEISIPSTVNSVGDFTFQGCTKLKEITFSKNIIYFGDGIFAKSGKTTIYCTKGSKAYEFFTELKDPNITIKTTTLYKVTFKDGSKVVKTQDVQSGKGATAPKLTKKSYTLSWDKSFSKVTKNLTVNAKWTKVTAPAKAPTSLKLTSPETKQLKVTYKKVSGASGYRIQYSTNKNFTASTTKAVHTTKLTYTLTKLSAKKTYYVRVTAFKLDSTSAKVYSKKHATKNLKTK